MALIQPRPPIPGTPPDDGDFDERESIAMEGRSGNKCWYTILRKVPNMLFFLGTNFEQFTK